MRSLGKNQKHWRNILSQLTNLGFVSEEKSAGMSTKYSLIESKAINIISLPTGKELLEKREPGNPGTENSRNGKIEKSKNRLQENSMPNLPGSKNQYSASTESVMPEIKEGGVKSHLGWEGGEVYQKFLRNQKLNIDASSDPPFCRGAISRIDIINYLQKTNKQLVTFQEIQERFGCETYHLDKLLGELCKEGTTYQAKPGKYVLL